MNNSNQRREHVINQELIKVGLRGKINAMCCSCIYDPYSSSGSWRKQVDDCTSYKCPLFDARPLSRTPVKTPNRCIKQLNKGDRANG